MRIHDLFVIDNLGVDPLSSTFFDTIKSVKAYTYYTITPQEHLNPALTSFNRYKSKIWWQAILAYNDILDMWEYTEGTRIRLPDINEMTTVIQRQVAERPERIVNI